jgi:hypothetical protein
MRHPQAFGPAFPAEQSPGRALDFGHLLTLAQGRLD